MQYCVAAQCDYALAFSSAHCSIPPVNRHCQVCRQPSPRQALMCKRGLLVQLGTLSPGRCLSSLLCNSVFQCRLACTLRHVRWRQAHKPALLHHHGVIDTHRTVYRIRYTQLQSADCCILDTSTTSSSYCRVWCVAISPHLRRWYRHPD